MAMLTTGRQVDSTSSDAVETLEPARRRVREFLHANIEFIPHPEFEGADADDHRLPAADRFPADVSKNVDERPRSSMDLPSHLRRLCEAELLTREQEKALFREMNHLKFRAYALHAQLESDSNDLEAVTEIENLLNRAQRIRDTIIRANLRLVISIVKRFVAPHQSFDEMLSDGIVALIQAVEKFDFDRGFRFSTYAYRAIARSVYRSTQNHRREKARFTRDAQDWAFDQESRPIASAIADQAWSNLSQLMSTLIQKLDRRERFIIRSRYALGAHRKTHTFQELADKLGVSKERVRHLEQRAVAKLRQLAANCKVDELFGAAIVS